MGNLPGIHDLKSCNLKKAVMASLISCGLFGAFVASFFCAGFSKTHGEGAEFLLCRVRCSLELRIVKDKVFVYPVEFWYSKSVSNLFRSCVSFAICCIGSTDSTTFESFK